MDHLPQLAGRPMVTDGGLETDLTFNHGVELEEFAACCPWRRSPWRRSHAELDDADDLDGGDLDTMSAGHDLVVGRLPAVTVVGGCCGTDASHVARLWGVDHRRGGEVPV